MKRALLVGMVASALALSACGGSSAPKKTTTASFKSSLSSIGASPDLQVTATASFTGASSTTAENVLKLLSFHFDFSNPNGGALSQSNGSEALDITAKIGSATFIDLREIDSNLYFKANVNALSQIKGTKLSAQELASVELVFGGRWFELPKSVLNALVPSKDATKVQGAESAAVESKFIDAITKAINAGSHTSLGNGGYSASGTLASLEEAVLPALNSVQHGSTPGKLAKGTYSLTITGSGSSATGATFSITAPHGSSGDATATITLAFAHAGLAVSVPSGATEITPALIRQLESGS
jgi:hypothetical protein